MSQTRWGSIIYQYRFCDSLEPVAVITAVNNNNYHNNSNNNNNNNNNSNNNNKYVLGACGRTRSSYNNI